MTAYCSQRHWPQSDVLSMQCRQVTSHHHIYMCILLHAAVCVQGEGCQGWSCKKLIVAEDLVPKLKVREGARCWYWGAHTCAVAKHDIVSALEPLTICHHKLGLGLTETMIIVLPCLYRRSWVLTSTSLLASLGLPWRGRPTGTHCLTGGGRGREKLQMRWPCLVVKKAKSTTCSGCPAQDYGICNLPSLASQ
jgi:hypothetical protein